MGSPFLFPGDTKLEVVSRILRHAGVGTTADIYRHVRTEELHEEAARFAPFNTPALPEATGGKTAMPRGRPRPGSQREEI